MVFLSDLHPQLAKNTLARHKTSPEKPGYGTNSQCPSKTRQAGFYLLYSQSTVKV
jgi:hypothetical protein